MFLKRPLVAWAAGNGEAPGWFTVAYYVLILPWNLREEVMAQLAYVREWGGIFVVAIPRLCCTKS